LIGGCNTNESPRESNITKANITKIGERLMFLGNVVIEITLVESGLM
jgi:hypothetical protein